MIPSISQVCVLGSPFETDLADFKAAGFDAIECWITKLEDYLKRSSLDSVVHLLSELQIAMPVASLQGGLLAAVDRQHDSAWELLRRRLQMLRHVGCQTLVVVADLPHPANSETVDGAINNLAAAADLAEREGLRLAVEFHPRAGFITNVQTAVALLDQIGSPSLGICLDTFHFQVGPSKREDLGLLTVQNLFHVQVADVVDRPREFAGDGDRILPADGEIAWEPLMTSLREISYAGLVSLEVMNPHFAQISARQLADVGKLALERILA